MDLLKVKIIITYSFCYLSDLTKSSAYWVFKLIVSFAELVPRQLGKGFVNWLKSNLTTKRPAHQAQFRSLVVMF